MWLEWLQTLLYCLLAIAVVSLVFALLNLALLCWKEFHSETTQAHAKVAPAREAESESVTPAKTQPMIGALFLLLCCCQ